MHLLPYASRSRFDLRHVKFTACFGSLPRPVQHDGYLVCRGAGHLLPAVLLSPPRSIGVHARLPRRVRQRRGRAGGPGSDRRVLRAKLVLAARGGRADPRGLLCQGGGETARFVRNAQVCLSSRPCRFPGLEQSALRLHPALGRLPGSRVRHRPRRVRNPFPPATVPGPRFSVRSAAALCSRRLRTSWFVIRCDARLFVFPLLPDVPGARSLDAVQDGGPFSDQGVQPHTNLRRPLPGHFRLLHGAQSHTSPPHAGLHDDCRDARGDDGNGRNLRLEAGRHPRRPRVRMHAGGVFRLDRVGSGLLDRPIRLLHSPDRVPGSPVALGTVGDACHPARLARALSGIARPDLWAERHVPRIFQLSDLPQRTRGDLLVEPFLARADSSPADRDLPAGAMRRFSWRLPCWSWKRWQRR